MNLSEIRARLSSGGTLTTDEMSALLQRANALVGAERVATTAPSAPAGDVPPTPIMRWLFDNATDLRQFVQMIWIAVPPGVSRAGLQTALAAVVQHHHALRLRVRRDGDEWRAEIPAEVQRQAVYVSEAVAADATQHAIAQIDPADGRMIHSVWCPAGSTQQERLLVAVHHLAIDGVAWRTLLADLKCAYEAAALNATPRLSRQVTSFRQWAHLLESEARADATLAQLPYWEEMLRPGTIVLAGKHDFDERQGGRAGILHRSIGPELTSRVLRAPARLQAHINDVLLTGMALAAMSVGGGSPGECSVLIDLESHGRTGLGDLADVTTTVGWFTTTYPVRLSCASHVGEIAAMSDSAVSMALKQVKQQLRTVPDEGVRYGLLRHLNTAASARLRVLPEPQLLFNYMGRFSTTATGATPWLPLPGVGDAAENTSAVARARPIELNAIVVDDEGGPRLEHHWSWRPEVEKGVVMSLATAWEAALERVAAVSEGLEAACLTPSDFQLVGLSQAQVDGLHRRYPDLVDVWPVAPLQRALLPHALAGGAEAAVYNVQIICTINGSLEVARLRAAIDALLERHPNLCVAFDVGTTAEPVQIVRRAREYGWTTSTLVDEPEGQQAERLTQLLSLERSEPFKCDGPPMLRFLLAQTAEDSWRLAFTTHHLLLDGWSTPILLDELAVLYTSGEIAPPVPYRSYVKWLTRQSAADAKRRWQHMLDGAQKGTVVAPEGHGHDAEFPASENMVLSRAETAALDEAARSAGVTVNACVELMWAAVLSALAQADDVITGVNVAGRPVELEGSAAIVGLCANTVPLRVRLEPAESVRTALTRLKHIHGELWSAAHLSLQEVQRAVGVAPLFDTLISFENYPTETSGGGVRDDLPGRLDIAVTSTASASHFPLTLLVSPAARLAMRLDFRPSLVSRSQARDIMGAVREMCRALGRDTTAPVAELQAIAGPLSGSRPAMAVAIGGSQLAGAAVSKVASHDAISYLLSGIFEEVLGVARVDPEESFFDLGGDSLLAVTLIKRIRDVLGANVPLGAIIDASRPLDIARIIGGERIAAAAFDRALWLRRSGARALVCLPPAGGLGWPYARLLRELDPDISIVCLQDPGLTDDSLVAQTFDEAVTSYLASLRNAVPAGPYALLGWSFGGRVAHALACRLEATGAIVAGVMIIDTYPPAASSAAFDGNREPRQSTPSAGAMNLYPFEDSLHGERVARLMTHNAALAELFSPRVFAGDVLVVAAAENAALPQAWRPYVAGELCVHVIEQPHTKILQSREVGKLVQAYMAARVPAAPGVR